MRDSPESSEIQIPRIILWAQLLFLYPFHQLLVIVNSLTSACQFPISFRSEQIYRQCDISIFRIRHVIERLDLFREVGDEERLVKLLRQNLFQFVCDVLSDRKSVV